ncbi:MAG: glutamate synthase-related protein [Eubacteriales bacterium]
MGSATSGRLASGSWFQYKRDGEHHLYNPQTIHLLQTAVRTGDYGLFQEYIATSDEAPVTLRTLLGYQHCRPIPLEEVEPIEKIVRRFKTGAMSGCISKERTNASLAMNQLGGKSNSGEGGEAVERLFTSLCSPPIKQIRTSGRFGVTGPYLASAKEIQIKMAQGAKPGEGGQLPAKEGLSQHRAYAAFHRASS